MSKWFLKEEDLKPKKKERVKDPDEKLVSTAALTRILAMSDLYEEGRIKNGLYCSSIGCDQYFDMTKEILDYWSPKEPKKREYSKEMYTKSGNVAHEILQDHLWSAGVLHPMCTTDGVFKEPRAEFTSGGLAGISGKIDLILPDSKYLAAIGAKTPKEGKQKEWYVCDIKQTGSKKYVGVSQFLPQSYRTQLSLYIKWFAQYGGHEKFGSFLYLDRDTPSKFKLFKFEKDENLIELSKKRAGIFWGHIFNRTLPEDTEPENTKEVISKMIEQQPERQWRHKALHQ